MDFFVFCFFYVICTIVLFLIVLFITKVILKKKMNSISNIADKEITRYFDSYDKFFNDEFFKGDDDDRTT